MSQFVDQGLLQEQHFAVIWGNGDGVEILIWLIWIRVDVNVSGCMYVDSGYLHWIHESYIHWMHTLCTWRGFVTRWCTGEWCRKHVNSTGHQDTTLHAYQDTRYQDTRSLDTRTLGYQDTRAGLLFKFKVDLIHAVNGLATDYSFNANCNAMVAILKGGVIIWWWIDKTMAAILWIGIPWTEWSHTLKFEVLMVTKIVKLKF